MLPDAYKDFAAKKGRLKTGIFKAEQDKSDKASLFVQEIAVDSLRHSDWAVCNAFTQTRARPAHS